MNTIDLIVCLVLFIAVWNGWRRGFIMQICSLAGLAAAVWLAIRWGAETGAWLKIDPQFSTPAGFTIILMGVTLGVAFAGRFIRRVFRFAGLGTADILLGVCVSVLKYALMLSVLMTTFDVLNRKYSFVQEQTLAQSVSYRPMIGLVNSLFPLFEWIEREIPSTEEKINQLKNNLPWENNLQES